MLRVTLSIFSLLLVLATGGCALFEESSGPKLSTGPQERIFYGTFEEIWRAAQLALQSPNSYPLRVNNMDTGTLESESLKGAQAWTPPYRQSPLSAGYTYRIIVRVVKGSLGDQSAYKVSVNKDAQLQRDFFSDPERISSDGLEEKVILYRIDREITIDRALHRVQKRTNQGL